MKFVVRILFATTLLASFGLAFVFLPGLVTAEELDGKELLTVDVEPRALQITCPGAFVQSGGSDGTQLGLIERFGLATLNAHVNGALSPMPSEEFVDPQNLEIFGQDQSTDLLSANQFQGLSLERAKGLIGLDCSQPLVSGWFINGEAGVGRDSILILSNPARTDVTVDVTFYAPSGVVSDRFTLAPGEFKLVTLAKYVLADDSFAIYFQSDGVGIAASLQNRNTLGLTPQGLEMVSAIPVAESSILIPGVTELALGFQSPQLVIFNPEKIATEVEIFGTGDSGRYLLETLLVEAGSIRVLDLEVPVDINGIALEATSKIIAGIKSPNLDPVLDFAWLLPASIFDYLAVIPNPFGGSVLNISNPSDSMISISIGNSGTYKSISVTPFGSVSIGVEAGDLSLQSAGKFAATLSLFGDSGYSVITPGKNSNSGSERRVLVTSGRGE